MSTPAITPDQTSAASALGQAVSTPNYPPSPDQGGPVPSPQASPAPQPSRLVATLAAIARVGATGLAGIPDRGRPSFVTGLGEGARAAQAAQAQQQEIKFRDMDSQIRIANLHHQDQELQLRTQEQQDAHQKAQDAQHDWNQDHGIDDTTIPNTGDAVIDHLTAQTAGQGAASVPAGTHLSADGTSIHVPTDTQKTRDGQLQQYKTFGPVFGLPSLPEGAQFVPPRLLDALTHTMQGYALDGTPVNHDILPQRIAAMQSQRDQLAKNNKATPDQLTALDNTIGILKANLDALDKHKAAVIGQNKAAELAAENSPENVKAAADKASAVKTAEEKAAFPYQLALAREKAKDKADTTNLDSVAFDPTYKNPDGTMGANVVMSKDDAKAKGLTHYKADPSTINTVVAGMNDVQNKLNQLADVANDPRKMAQVDPGLAAAMLAHGKGITLSVGGHGNGGSAGIGIDTSRINEDYYGHDVKIANQATRDFVAAYIGAHEAITQLPRLQTFGKSNRMTEKQMEAAQNLLPQPGDREFASQKMTSLQGMIDPLRKQIPHMPGAEQMPSWLETRQQRQTQQAPAASLGSNLGQWVSGLQPR